MAVGYQRQSEGLIVPNAFIRAFHFNQEFDAVEAAMSEVTGHNHDGTPGGGAPISLTQSVEGVLPLSHGGLGVTTAADARDVLGLEDTAITPQGSGGGLDADKLDGQEGAYYLALSNATGTLPSGNFNDGSHGQRAGGNLHAAATPSTAGFMTASDKAKLDGIEANATGDQTASEILTLFKSVDGAGSGADADLLDGQEGAFYRNASNLNAGTVPVDRLSGTYNITVNGSASQLNGQPASYYTNANNLNSGVVPAARLVGTYAININGNAATATNATSAATASNANNATNLDGNPSTFYRNAGNMNTGILPRARLSGEYDVSVTGSALRWDGSRKYVSASDPSGGDNGDIWFKYR